MREHSSGESLTEHVSRIHVYHYTEVLSVISSVSVVHADLWIPMLSIFVMNEMYGTKEASLEDLNELGMSEYKKGCFLRKCLICEPLRL
jgi:hypothetical protein